MALLGALIGTKKTQASKLYFSHIVYRPDHSEMCIIPTYLDKAG